MARSPPAPDPWAAPPSFSAGFPPEYARTELLRDKLAASRAAPGQRLPGARTSGEGEDQTRLIWPNPLLRRPEEVEVVPQRLATGVHEPVPKDGRRNRLVMPGLVRLHQGDLGIGCSSSALDRYPALQHPWRPGFGFARVSGQQSGHPGRESLHLHGSRPATPRRARRSGRDPGRSGSQPARYPRRRPYPFGRSGRWVTLRSGSVPPGSPRCRRSTRSRRRRPCRRARRAPVSTARKAPGPDIEPQPRRFNAVPTVHRWSYRMDAGPPL